MKAKVTGLMATFLLLFAALTIAPAQGAAAATTGNKFCQTSGSSTDAVIQAWWENGTKQNVGWYKCSPTGVNGFIVPNGFYCQSQWGYTYNGDWFGRLYRFTTNNNYLYLTCRHA